MVLPVLGWHMIGASPSVCWGSYVLAGRGGSRDRRPVRRMRGRILTLKAGCRYDQVAVRIGAGLMDDFGDPLPGRGDGREGLGALRRGAQVVRRVLVRRARRPYFPRLR